MRNEVFFMEDRIIARNDYLVKLISRKENGLIKILTGIRRRGNFTIYNSLWCLMLLQTIM